MLELTSAESPPAVDPELSGAQAVAGPYAVSLDFEHATAAWNLNLRPGTSTSVISPQRPGTSTSGLAWNLNLGDFSLEPQPR